MPLFKFGVSTFLCKQRYYKLIYQQTPPMHIVASLNIHIYLCFAYNKIIILLLQPSSLVIAMVMFASSCGSFLYQYLLGWLFDQYGVRCLTYLMIQSSLTLLLLHIAMHVMGRVKGPRFHRQQANIVDNETDVSDWTKQQDTAGDNDTEVPLNRTKQQETIDDNEAEVPMRLWWNSLKWFKSK